MRQIVLVGVVVMVALACGDTGGPGRGIDLSISVQPSPAQPGDTVRVAVIATPASGGVVDLIRLNATGLITAQDSMQFSGSGGGRHSNVFTNAHTNTPAAGSGS